MADGRVARRAARVAAILVTTALSQAAEARVQEYQVVRLLSYTTDCNPTKLEDRSGPKGPRRFFAVCDNLTFYPDGVEVECTDPEDDRSCRVLTAKRSFKQLELLNQDRSPP